MHADPNSLNPRCNANGVACGDLVRLLPYQRRFLALSAARKKELEDTRKKAREILAEWEAICPFPATTVPSIALSAFAEMMEAFSKTNAKAQTLPLSTP